MWHRSRRVLLALACALVPTLGILGVAGLSSADERTLSVEGSSPQAYRARWTLSVSPARSTDGVYQLSWSGGDGPVALEEARSERFAAARTVYSGGDRATVLTGRGEGTYHYRLRPLAGGQPGPPVATALVTVQHHTLARAFAFFAAGLFVFLATVTLVLRGSTDSVGDGPG